MSDRLNGEIITDFVTTLNKTDIHTDREAFRNTLQVFLDSLTDEEVNGAIMTLEDMISVLDNELVERLASVEILSSGLFK